MRRCCLAVIMLLSLLPALPAVGTEGAPGTAAGAGDGERSQAYYHFLLAKGYEFEHLYDEAIGELQKALQYDDQTAFIHGELAALYQRLGREGKALEHGHAAIEADPGDAKARVFLGMLYFKTSRRDEASREELTGLAIEQYREALAIDPGLEEACLDLSHIYHVNDRDDEALELLERFLEQSPYNERALFALGNIHWSRREWDKALEDYQRILEINPDSIRALLDVADTYNNLDEPESALPFYLRALEENPESFNILSQVGACYEQLRKLDLAARYYQKALAVKPDSLETVEALGNVSFMGHRYLEATGFYLQVLEVEPDRLVTRFNLARSYKGLGEVTLALAHLERLQRRMDDALSGGEGTRDLRRFRRLVLEELANIHVGLEQYDEALAVLRQASAVGEKPDADVLHNLARVHHMRGDFDAAMKALARCRELYPDRSEADLLEVEMRLDAGRLEGVDAALDRLENKAAAEGLESDLWRRLVVLLSDNGYGERAVRLLEKINAGEGGKTALSLFLLARARVDSDDLDGALAVIRDARQRYPEDFDFTLLEGEILLRREQVDQSRELLGALLGREGVVPEDFLRASLLYSRFDRFERAEEVLLSGLERFNGDGALLFQLAATRERLGRFADAEKTFRRLIELEPDNAAALNYLGYMLAERGERLDEAMALVGQALRIEPRNGAYLDSMGWALFRAGMTRQAGSYLLDAMKQIPGDPTICEHVGDYYLALGERELALEHFRKAIELGVDDPEAVRLKIEDAERPPESSTGGSE